MHCEKVSVVGQTMAFKNAHILIPEPMNVLIYMAKGLCRCDHAESLEMGRFYSGLFEWVQYNNKKVKEARKR